jgi:ADP-ribosyl-[dinitrogen reductase] hydrolase
MSREFSRDRAVGAVLGALVGDAAGAVLEFLREPVEERHVELALSMPGGGVWSVAPGQITDDGELTMSLLRALVENPERPTERAAVHYAKWVESGPFDIGTTTRASLGCLRDPELKALAETEGAFAVMTTIARRRCMSSKANGSLMRITPLGVWGASRPREVALRAAAADARLSHPSDACVGAARAYVSAIRYLLLVEGDVEGALLEAHAAIATDDDDDDGGASFAEVRAWLEDAKRNVIVPCSPQDGFVRIGFTHAFRHLMNGTSYIDAIRETLSGGGDSDTNACIVGGLLGARWGASAIPKPLREAVLDCDTSRGAHPRPDFLHPRDALRLVGALQENTDGSTAHARQ